MKVRRVVFADSWEQFFSRHGLKSFGDFFEYTPTETIGINNKRSVVTFSLSTDSQKKQFFMKRFFHPHFKDMLFTWRSFGSMCSQARCELENAGLLLNNGIETYKPVCFGEQTKCGIEANSFIVTEKLSGQALTDFVRQKWHNLQRQQKEKIIAGIGKFIRSIHELNISLPDLYVWHIFLKENPDTKNYDFAVIDLHRMSRNVTNRNTKIKNLGRLHHSMVDKYFDEDLKRSFIESYAGDNWDGDINTLASQVKKYSDAVSAKRNPKPY
jgi:tRNA A-37 threonylcarbamoyl transferase component Bud32